MAEPNAASQTNQFATTMFDFEMKEDVQVSAVGVKLPEFIEQMPELWFLQADAQFILAGISKEETKYYHVLSRLPANILIECRDVIPQSFIPGTFERLKKAIMDRYTPSNDQRIKQVLDTMQFNAGDQPSAFFRKMLSTAEGVLSYDIVLQRFRERLPTGINTAIAALISKLNLMFKQSGMRPIDDETIMLSVADSVATLTNVYAISDNREPKHRPQQVRSSYRSQSRSRKRSSPSRNVQTQKFRENGPWCRNHYMYREQTKKCSRPQSCTFRNHQEN